MLHFVANPCQKRRRKKKEKKKKSNFFSLKLVSLGSKKKQWKDFLPTLWGVMRLSFCIPLIIYCPVIFPSLEHVEEYCDIFLRTFFARKRTKWMSVLTYSTYPLMFLFSHHLWTFTRLQIPHMKQKFIQRINLLFHSSGGEKKYVKQDESDYKSKRRGAAFQNRSAVASIKYLLKFKIWALFSFKFLEGIHFFVRG